MPRAVRFDRYGDVDVLQETEVPRPEPGPGQVLVRVPAAGIDLGKAKIRQGPLHQRFPTHFPSGEGSDLAGIVEDVGPGVDRFRPDDPVLASPTPAPATASWRGRSLQRDAQARSPTVGGSGSPVRGRHAVVPVAYG